MLVEQQKIIYIDIAALTNITFYHTIDKKRLIINLAATEGMCVFPMLGSAAFTWLLYFWYENFLHHSFKQFSKYIVS